MTINIPPVQNSPAQAQSKASGLPDAMPGWAGHPVQDMQSGSTFAARSAGDRGAETRLRKRAAGECITESDVPASGPGKKAKLDTAEKPAESHIFTLSEAKDATDVAEEYSSLKEYFPYPDADMLEIFGCLDQAMLFVDTSLYVDEEEPAEEDGRRSPHPEKGQISFTSLYGNPPENSHDMPIMIFLRRYRDLAISSFQGKDIIKQQIEQAQVPVPQIYVIKDISSTSGLLFLDENYVEHKEFLSAHQLDQFLAETVNGRGLRSTLAMLGMRALSARVIREEPEEPDSVVIKAGPLHNEKPAHASVTPVSGSVG